MFPRPSPSYWVDHKHNRLVGEIYTDLKVQHEASIARLAEQLLEQWDQLSVESRQAFLEAGLAAMTPPPDETTFHYLQFLPFLPFRKRRWAAKLAQVTEHQQPIVDLMRELDVD